MIPLLLNSMESSNRLEQHPVSVSKMRKAAEEAAALIMSWGMYPFAIEIT